MADNLNPESLCRTVAFALNVEEVMVNMDTKQSDLDEWDSFGQIAIIASVESKFQISFLAEEFFLFHSVIDLFELAKLKGSA